MGVGIETLLAELHAEIKVVLIRRSGKNGSALATGPEKLSASGIESEELAGISSGEQSVPSNHGR